MPSNHNITILLCLLLFCCGCVGTRYLEKDELLLYKQYVRGAENIDDEDLEELFVQETNKQIPVIPFSPYVWFYQIGLKNYDPEEYRENIEDIRNRFDQKIAETDRKKKIQRLQSRKLRKIQREQRNIEEGNVLMRWGEPLAIFDSANIERTKENINLYLHSKGYFKGSTTAELKRYGKKIVVTYEVNEGMPYIIDTVFINIPDSAIRNLFIKHQDDQMLRKDENYDQEVLTRERERITNLLKNHGYYTFSRQYIDFEVDTSYQNTYDVAVRTTIRNPSGQDSHRIYRLDSLNFIADASETLNDIDDHGKYRGITFIPGDIPYNLKVLSRRIFLKKDSLYSREATLNTQRQLSNLDNFRFINISYDSTGEKFVGNIYVSPLNRYQWSNEFGVNVTQGFPGPYYNLSFKKRNVFGGLENFDITARIGIEGVAPASRVDDDFYKSTEAGVNASLTFPQFILPLSSRLKERLGQVNPKTRLTGGYSFTNRPEYTRENISFSTTYSWERGRNRLYSFTIADLSLINSNLDSTFQERLVRLKQNLGNNLINSFNPSFVSSMKFTITGNTNDYGFTSNNSSFYRFFLESGGTTLNFVDTKIFEEDPISGRGKLEYYKFLKFSGDFRKHMPVNSKSSIAWRFNAGLAVPYSDNRILPYEKYFFAGGSSGIRAWRPRRLGPGSYTPIDTTGAVDVISYDFEQQGEILIEGSLEWRQNLIGFIEYAWFLDFGNIWTIHEDASRQGARFKLDSFLTEMAVGSGLGLRFDFSFLILRLDAGVKIYDPARPVGKRFILSDGFYDPPFIRKEAETLVFNIGIGYPF